MLACPAFGQWAAIANSTLADICPTVPGAAATGGSPMAGDCKSAMTAWSGGAFDTTRNRLMLWGGGHGDYYGNELYGLTVTGAGALAVVKAPSDVTGIASSCETVPADSSPTSRHTYNGLVYLPVQDALLAVGGSISPCGTLSTHTWMLNLASLTWADKNPGGTAYPSTTSGGGNNTCAYDSVTQKAYCLAPDSAYKLMAYDPSENTWAQLANDLVTGNTQTAAIDPERRIMLMVGQSSNFSGGLKIFAVSLSDYTSQDWTATSSGCSAMDVSYPGVTYDSRRKEFALYPNTGDTVYTYNPDTRECVAQAFASGPLSSSLTDGINVGEPGIFGRFTYSAASNKYVVWNNPSADAYTLALPVEGATTGISLRGSMRWK